MFLYRYEKVGMGEIVSQVYSVVICVACAPYLPT